MFWNKVVGWFFKMVRKVTGSPEPIVTESPKDPSVKNP
jgi:hypothetical protein